jgi:hypothetical protein
MRMVVGCLSGQKVPGIMGVEIHCFWKEASSGEKNVIKQKNLGRDRRWEGLAACAAPNHVRTSVRDYLQ